MKKPYLLVGSLFALIFLAGCGTTTLPTPEPIENTGNTLQLIDNEAIDNIAVTDTNSEELAISINNSDYLIESLNANLTPDQYSGMTVYKVTYLPDNSRSYLITMSGDRIDFSQARFNNMLPGEPLPLFISLSQGDAQGDDRYSVMAPIDTVLVAKESGDSIYVLDFDDASGMQNKMTLTRIQDLILYVDI